MKTDSQNAQIKRWLLKGNPLTSLEALDLFGCMRLASRIHDLREQGMNIAAKKIITATGKRVTQYTIQ